MKIIKRKSRKIYFIFLKYGLRNFKSKEVDEETPVTFRDYAALKFSGEKIVKSYSQVFDLNYSIVRPSALYGERCISRRVGQIFIENALNDIEIRIDGDGEEKLDFTYIKDLVQGVKKIISTDKSRNQIFNLTFGSSRKINDMLGILKRILKSKS